MSSSSRQLSTLLAIAKRHPGRVAADPQLFGDLGRLLALLRPGEVAAELSSVSELRLLTDLSVRVQGIIRSLETMIVDNDPTVLLPAMQPSPSSMEGQARTLRSKFMSSFNEDVRREQVYYVKPSFEMHRMDDLTARFGNADSMSTHLAAPLVEEPDDPPYAPLVCIRVLEQLKRTIDFRAETLRIDKPARNEAEISAERRRRRAICSRFTAPIGAIMVGRSRATHLGIPITQDVHQFLLDELSGRSPKLPRGRNGRATEAEVSRLIRMARLNDHLRFWNLRM